MTFKTADLSDAHSHGVQILELPLQDFGGARTFAGRISTLYAPGDNTWVRKVLEEPGAGRVLVIDGGGGLSCALVGDQLGQLAVQNGWSGIIVNGCVRDCETLRTLSLGVKALATHPRKSEKRNFGQKDTPIRFGNVTFLPGAFVYADADGVLTSEQDLLKVP